MISRQNAKTGERTSEPFDIDNSAPIVSIEGSPARSGDLLTIRFSAKDVSSHITRAEFSINGGPWRNAYSDDGLTDDKNESFTVTADVKGVKKFAISLRVFDAVGNIGTSRYQN